MGQIKNIKLHIVTDIKCICPNTKLKSMKIRHILGCMSFGGAFNEAQSHQLLKDWVRLGYNEADNALMYSGGKSEKIMGNLHLSRDPKILKIACKANPGQGFKSEDIVKQLDISLQSLCVPSVDIFYLHWPDHDVPIEETLKGVNQLHMDGKFKEFGLSNYASWEVADIYHICKQSGYVLPTVYQGMYNALTRDIELELIPCLRRFGIRFNAYNPLAGGMLTGKYDFSKEDERQPSGRFFVDNSNSFTAKWAKAYQDRYWRDNYKTGVQHVIKVLDETYNKEVTLLEASLRWLQHHSNLIDDDGLILGFSKPEHFQQNIDAARVTAPLHENVIQAFDEAWNNIKSDCPKYNR